MIAELRGRRNTNGGKLCLPTTRLGHCLSCRSARVFSNVLDDVWACMACLTQRELSIDHVTESIRDGDFGRFWASVKITPFCWVWLRKSRAKSGGPQFQLQGKSVKIARAAYYLTHGVWPTGGAVRVCFNAFCVRPDHLRDIMQTDVSPTMSRLGRLRHIRQSPRLLCRRGHRLAGDNVTTASGGKRYCRRCRNMVNRARYKRLIEAGVVRSAI